MNGASAAENQFNIDGISTTSLMNGGTSQDAVFEILQEVQVKTGGMDAEYGGAMGGVISAITKSGGNFSMAMFTTIYSGNAQDFRGPEQRLLLDPTTTIRVIITGSKGRTTGTTKSDTASAGVWSGTSCSSSRRYPRASVMPRRA